MKQLAVLIFFVTIFSLTGMPGFMNIFKTETAQAATKAQWRHAKRACRKKYGRRLIRTKITQKGKIHCIYRKRTSNNSNRTYADVVKFCRKKYKGNLIINARKKFGKWYCTWGE